MRRTQPGEYGVWVSARGYAAQFVRPVSATVDGQRDVIELSPTGSVVFRPDGDALADVTTPYVVWCVADANGNAVYPGGETQTDEIVETGGVFLVGEHADGYVVDTIPPGHYTILWEVYAGPDAESRSAPNEAAVLSGEQEVEVAPGRTEAVLIGE